MGAILTLDQLTLKHGNSPSYGGAVEIMANASLNARYCTFENNVAGQFGGAVDVFRGKLKVEQCLFLNNSVTGSTAQAGGAISVYSIEPAQIINSTFVGNLQENSGGLGGGALYAENSDLAEIFNLRVEHCTFKDNLDEAFNGSAILSSAAGMEVLVRNNIFEDEQGRVLDVVGGGVFVTEGGNFATDATRTTYTQGGVPQNIILLDNSSDRTTDPTAIPATNGDALLLPLADNGGPTRTCALDPTSPAIGAALARSPSSETIIIDQKGAWRDDPDCGAFEYDEFKRINVNEIFFGTDQFIEFYNPRESEALDMNGTKLYVDGTLIHTFGAQAVDPGAGFVLDDAGWLTDFELNKESGQIVLKNASDQTLLVVDYVGNFGELPSPIGIQAIDFDNGGSQEIVFINLTTQTFNFENAKLFFDNVLVHTFDIADTDFVAPDADSPAVFTLTETAWGGSPTLDTDFGRIKLLTATDELILEFEYVDDPDDNTVGINALDVIEQSINRYPDYEGPFLPHRRVLEAMTGTPIPTDTDKLSSKNLNVDGSPLDGGNAPPFAVADPIGYEVFADQTLDIDVMANDIEFDRTDVLRIFKVLPVDDGDVSDADLGGTITLTNLPTVPSPATHGRQCRR